MKARIRNLEFHRSHNDVVLAQQHPSGEIKGASVSVSCLLFRVCGVRVCVCVPVRTRTHTHPYAQACVELSVLPFLQAYLISLKF